MPCPRLLGESSASSVKVEAQWSKCLADSDVLSRTWWLKSRIAVCLEALAEHLPKYSEKDLLVCHRQNDKGAWKCEVWTKRPFRPSELMLAPHTSQLKDTHLTAAANAVVGLPQHGRGKHPDGGSLALDGRGRACLAKAGLIDSNEHTGSLYWLVERSSSPAEANLVLESVCWDHRVDLKLPRKKQKVSSDWQSQDLPAIPLLVNRKVIKEHVRLVVYQPEKKDKGK